MKSVLKIFGCIVLAAVIGFAMITCVEDDGTTSGGKNPKAVTGVTLTPTTLSLTVGGSTETLTATVAPVNATNKAVTWSTSDAAVATVSGGIVTAVGAGTATITVTTTNGSKTATCAVTVTTGGGNLVKSVSVGAQVGTLVAGTAGTITYPVTTANIANGTYPVAVTLPTGVTIGNSGLVTISDNAGTLTLAGNTSTVAGSTDTLTLTLDGVTSGTFSINITFLGKTVSVGAQVGTLAEKTAGTVTYPVTTVNVADGTYSATVANRPSGVTVSGQVTISGNAGTLTLAGNTSTAAGTTDTLTLTLDGATSGTFSITIMGKTVSVGAQVGTLVAGIAGTVTYPVTTVNIADGTYPVTVANRPTGITIGNSGNITISDNAGTLTLVGSASTAAMTINTLTLTLDGATSGTFSITILGKTVSVGAQVGTLYDGTAGTVTYPVTTNIADGTYSATVANCPTGVTVSGQVTISGNAGTLTLAGNTSTAAGTTDTLTLTLDGVTSGTFSIVITPHDHTYSTTWSSNTEQHWKECTVAGCNAKTETDNHLLTDGICSICGYEPPFPMQMVSISAGTLKWPNATITLSAFKMGKYQVTQEQYQEVMGTNPSWFNSNPAAGEVQGKRPVEQVSWYSALVFCNKLSILEGLTPAYSINGSTNPDEWGTVPTSSNATWNAVIVVSGSTGYRLPTEAQWEYACRAGSTTNWHFGDTESELVNYAWYSANSNERTHQVGLKLPNAFGLYDMHGNVAEWCWDWRGNLPTSNQTDYTGVVSASYRMRRGVYYGGSAVDTHSSYRNYFYPYDSNGAIGFRLVRP